MITSVINQAQAHSPQVRKTLLFGIKLIANKAKESLTQMLSFHLNLGLVRVSAARKWRHSEMLRQEKDVVNSPDSSLGFVTLAL